MHDQKPEIRNKLAEDEGPRRRTIEAKIDAAIKEFQAAVRTRKTTRQHASVTSQS